MSKMLHIHLFASPSYRMEERYATVRRKLAAIVSLFAHFRFSKNAAEGREGGRGVGRKFYLIELEQPIPVFLFSYFFFCVCFAPGLSRSRKTRDRYLNIVTLLKSGSLSRRAREPSNEIIETARGGWFFSRLSRIRPDQIANGTGRARDNQQYYMTNMATRTGKHTATYHMYTCAPPTMGVKGHSLR